MFYFYVFWLIRHCSEGLLIFKKAVCSVYLYGGGHFPPPCIVLIGGILTNVFVP